MKSEQENSLNEVKEKSNISNKEKQRPIFLVSGLSGAGKSTALQVFEDMNFFTADGLPPSLIHEFTLLAYEPDMQHFRGIALGLDMRFDMRYFENCAHCEKKQDISNTQGKLYCETRSKNCTYALKKIFQLRDGKENDKSLSHYNILFLDASNQSIIKRYASTRRPHPLESGGFTLENAIIKERQDLKIIRQNADIVLDTSNFTLHDLRRAIQHRFSHTQENDFSSMHINLISFGFKYGLPQEADMVFDVRFLANPYFVDELREFSGLDRKIEEYIFQHEDARIFREKLLDHLFFMLPYYRQEGRYKVCIAIGCTGGRHRSVALTQFIYQEFLKRKHHVTLEHKHLKNDTY